MKQCLVDAHSWSVTWRINLTATPTKTRGEEEEQEEKESQTRLDSSFSRNGPAFLWDRTILSLYRLN